MNFGDLLGPLIVDAIVQERRLDKSLGTGRLLSVGSTVHLSKPGDVIWGAGVNAKVESLGGAPDLDVRSVRGPLTRDRLVSVGTTVPPVFGDPALLMARYFPSPRAGRTDRGGITIVPNFWDWPDYRRDDRAINPRANLWQVVSRISNSELVVSSSLHGVVVAESYGVPAVLLRSRTEPPFKYIDYVLGTGRDEPRFCDTIAEALDAQPLAAPQWSAEELLSTFPDDLWPSLSVDPQDRR